MKDMLPYQEEFDIQKDFDSREESTKDENGNYNYKHYKTTPIGIIPCLREDVNFGVDYPYTSLLLHDDLTLLDRSLTECAWAGCKMIVILANDRLSKHIRNRYGTHICDPYEYIRAERRRNTGDAYPEDKVEYIPLIFMQPRTVNLMKRNSESYHILSAAIGMFYGMRKGTFACNPNNFYVSFPTGVYHPKLALTARQKFTTSWKGRGYKNYPLSNVSQVFTHGDMSIRTGYRLGFSMTIVAAMGLAKRVRLFEYYENWYDSLTRDFVLERLPKKRSGHDITFEETFWELGEPFYDEFTDSDIKRGLQERDISEYSYTEINSWKDYRKAVLKTNFARNHACLTLADDRNPLTRIGFSVDKGTRERPRYETQELLFNGLIKKKWRTPLKEEE
jgi:hypothetical protein